MVRKQRIRPASISRMKERTWEIYDSRPSTCGYWEIHKQGVAGKLMTVKIKALILFNLF
jgi:hypothetical protein